MFQKEFKSYGSLFLLNFLIMLITFAFLSFPDYDFRQIQIILLRKLVIFTDFHHHRISMLEKGSNKMGLKGKK